MKFFVFCITFFSCLHASVSLGRVSFVDGIVKIKRAGTIKKERVVLGTEVNSGDLLMTSQKSVVKIELSDASVLVLAQQSSVLFNSLKALDQKKGKVLYKITSRNAKNSLKVKTPFAIIGIKGTTFIVNAQEKNSYVTLKEGLIGIASLKKEFALYRQKREREFDTYRSQQQSKFEKFKNAQNEYEKVEYTKIFDLNKGHRVFFGNASVKEDVMDDTAESEFAFFEKIVQESK